MSEQFISLRVEKTLFNQVQQKLINEIIDLVNQLDDFGISQEDVSNEHLSLLAVRTATSMLDETGGENG